MPLITATGGIRKEITSDIKLVLYETYNPVKYRTTSTKYIIGAIKSPNFFILTPKNELQRKLMLFILKVNMECTRLSGQNAKINLNL
jgi:hypothetical protein